VSISIDFSSVALSVALCIAVIRAPCSEANESLIFVQLCFQFWNQSQHNFFFEGSKIIILLKQKSDFIGAKVKTVQFEQFELQHFLN
jgi:hypothetical protein